MSQSPKSSQNYVSSTEISPKKSQWALINDYKALQTQNQKKLQRSIKRQKQRQFKQHLDSQVMSKDELKHRQKQKQQHYFQQILQKDLQLKERQSMKKNNQIDRYKNISLNNKQLSSLKQSLKNNNNDNNYKQSFQIGVSTLQQQKIKRQKAKRQIIDSLDKQLKIKAQQKAKQKQRSLQLDNATLKYQIDNNVSERQKYPRNYDNQNKKVYNHFQIMNRQKSMRERQIDEKLINKARQAKLREQEQKFLQNKFQKRQKNMQVKEYLDNQVKFHQRKLSQQKRVNPQEHSYSVIGNLFRDKPSPYDKKQYYQYLRYQAQQKKSQKNKYTYMNQQQYKMNLNQLNKAISGSYAHNSYVDRSLGSLGDDQKIRKQQFSINNDDTDAVKMKIHNLKQMTTKSQDKY